MILTKQKKPYKDLTGHRFGRLLVLSLVNDVAGENIPTRWLCRCDCGREVVVRGYNLKSGQTRSCGCLQREMAGKYCFKHGKTGSRLHNIWVKMKGRCNRCSEAAYPYYGGRGIKVCDEWQEFMPFYEWAMANGYRDDLTLDRIDPNGDYEPSNCRWLPLKAQNRNKRNNVHVVYNGEIRLLCEWAELFNCPPQDVCREIMEREGRVF